MNPEDIPIVGHDTAQILYAVLLLALVVLFVSGGIFRKRVGDRGRVWLTCVTMILMPLALLSATYARHGKEFVEKGVRAPRLVTQVQNLERYLTSEEHLTRRDERYSLLVLGDSTHFFDLKATQEMLPQIERAFPKPLKDKIEMSGLRSMGLDAFDYYFLLNRLVEDKPDMILLPINLRTFGDNWATADMTYFPSLERFTQWQEIPRASYISSDSRPIRWDLINMRKLDYAVMDGRVSKFLRGAKLNYNKQKQALDDGFKERFAELGGYIPSSFLDEKDQFLEQSKRNYTLYVSRDHSMLDAFRALNRLARRHGIRVVYYTVESERKDVRQEENFHLIEEVLLKDPDVHFIDTLGLLDFKHFMEREHLTPEGIQLLARYLANKVGEIIQQELGLTDITFVPIKKGTYNTESQLQILVKNVESMSLSELEAFAKTLRPEQADGVRQIWERKHGLLP
jgi:hypothetical protein